MGHFGSAVWSKSRYRVEEQVQGRRTGAGFIIYRSQVKRAFFALFAADLPDFYNFLQICYIGVADAFF